MNDEPLPRRRWPEFSRLLDEALDRSEDARAAWLDALEARDPDAATWLRRVLGHGTAASAATYLERPRIERGPDADARAGATIGSYRLVREIGTSGMGVVWLAERADGQLERSVALKLPHVHLLVGAIRERFARERGILARLNHPNIATLYDAGLAADGRPYLALELVDGVPITQWCREHRVGIAARLDAMRKVMDAVEYAHARLVVHRDLKPSNVLVTADGDVKLLDFGIAKMLAPDEAATDEGMLTRIGQRMATPAYSAPEQMAGGAVTTRADVYALGVMLYELLCGRRPILDAETHAQAARSESPRCSTQVDAAFASTVDGVGVAALRRAIEGDLDAILAKAIDPLPERRYGSVEAFAADLERHRRHRPILAQRIGRLTIAAKFVRRHRLSTAFVVALVAAIGGGVTLVAWQANEARQQTRRAEAIKEFLVDIFGASDPRIASDRPRGGMTARELLDKGAARIEREFADDPRTEIDLLATVAAIYRELGAVERSIALTARKIELARKTYGPLSNPVLESATEAASFACAGVVESCNALQAQANDLITRAGRERSVYRATWWTTEGVRMRALPDKDAERRSAFEKGVALYREVAPKHAGHVTAVEELASDLEARGDLAASIALHEEALRVGESLPRRNDAEMQIIYGNLALAYQQRGELAKAGAMFDKAADIAERTSGRDFPLFWGVRAVAARTRHLAGERVSADAAFDGLIALLPPPTVHVVDATVVRQYYGERLAAEGRPALAVPLLEIAERDLLAFPRDEFDLRLVRLRLGDALDRLDRPVDARAKLSASLDDYLAHAKPDQQPVLAARERWGRFLLERGDVTGAARQFEEIVQQTSGRRLSHIALAHGDLARVALARKDVTTASTESELAMDLWNRREGFYDVRMGPYVQRIRADALVAAGRVDEAQRLEDEAWQASERYDAPESPTRVHRRLSAQR